jgi:tetratricopeptide (TPR) repeat protein
MLKWLCIFVFSFFTYQLQAQDRGLIVKPYTTTLNSPLKGDSGKRKAALIVGISDYSSNKLTLKYANKDAALFFSYLTDIRGFPRENVFMLPDSAATSGRIYNSIFDLLKWLVAGDELVLYFAGHGDVQTVLDFDEAFFLAWDASDSRNYHGTGGTVKFIDLHTYTDRLASSRKVKVSLIMDACHAGFDLHKDGFLKAQNNLSEGFNKISKLLGSAVNEFSYEADSVGHGLFTWYLVQGMMGLADEPADNKVTMEELSSWVKNRVAAATKGKQNPVMTAPDPQQLFADVTPDNKSKALAYFRNKKYDGYLAGRGTGAEDTVEHSALQQYVDQYNYFLTQEKFYITDSSSLGIIKKLGELNSTKATDLRLSLQNHLAEILETRSQLVLNEYLKGKSEQPGAAIYYRAGVDAGLADSLLPANDPRKKNNQVMESFHKAYSYIRYENFEKYGEAEQLLRKAVALENRAAYIYVAISYLMEYQHKYDSAIYYAKKAETIIPTWSHPKNVLGNLYEALHQYEKSLSYHRSVIALDSSYIWSYNNIAVSLLEMERTKEAEFYFDKSLSLKKQKGTERLNRDWAISYGNLAAIYRERGLFEKAEKYYAIADSIDPTYTFALREQSALFQQTDGEKAEALLKRTIHLMPFEAENFYTLAEFYRNFSDGAKTTIEIETLYKKAIALNPYNEDYYAGLGLFLIDEKKPDSSFRWFTKGIIASGGTAGSYYNMGYYYKNTHRPDSAIFYFKKALLLNPYDIFVSNDLAALLVETGDSISAENVLLQQAPLHKQSPRMFYQLGNFYFRIGKFTAAILQYEKCIALDDSYLNAISSLAYVHLLNGNDKSSRKYMQQVSQLDKDQFRTISYIHAVIEQSYTIPLATRLNWLNNFLSINPYDEVLSEAIAATAYEAGIALNNTFLQTKLAEQKTSYTNPALIKWLLLLAIELNNTQQIQLFAKRYLNETLNTDPAVEAVAMKLTGNIVTAKKIKRSVQQIEIKTYRVNFKKIFSGI